MPVTTHSTLHICAISSVKSCQKDTVFAVEAVTNSIPVSDQIRATLPGQWVNCGGGGLGWSGGGALGVKLAVDAISEAQGASKKMVVQIVRDGSFLFSVPSSVYWISHRYGIPILTIVLNNKGKISTTFFFYCFPCFSLISNSNMYRLERPPKINAPRPPRWHRI